MTRFVRPIVAATLFALAVTILVVWRADGAMQAGGLGHTVIATSAGSVFTFGLNNNGQIGDNSTTTRKVPTQISGLSGITDVAAGSNHTLALDNTGRVWAWGDNLYGQLGNGANPTDSKVPVQLTLTSVVAIAAGDNHSLALRSNGDLYVWGRNNSGQIGNGGNTQQNTPLLILLNVAAIGAGGSHSLAVKTDGTVWSWGLNTNGQLGDGTYNNTRTSPVQMSSVTSAAAVAGGASHSLILLTDGTVKATGLNSSGQLGIGSNSQQTTATSISTLSGVTAIAAGANHSLAITSSGALYAWGNNGNGQLGNGSTQNSNSPTAITALSNITKIGAGDSHSIAVSSTGVVYTWGLNSSSQLGDGTSTSRTTPGAISGTNYDWKVGTPELSVASGTYTTTKSVVVTEATPGAELHYTQNGAEPTTTDTMVTSGSSISVTVSETLKVKGFKGTSPASDTAVGDYTLQAATPTFSPAAGTYTTAQTVSISTTTSGASIRYTTDGTTPTATSTLYTGAFSVGTTTTVKAIALKDGWSNSNVGSATYTMNFGTLAAPTVTPATGTYESGATVTMSATPDTATIRYTTNGTTPTSSSPAYTGPFVVDVTTTVKAKAFHPDYATSAETARTYTITVAPPVFSPGAGTYAAPQAITISTPTSGATITYTLNGVDPVSTDPAIASGGTVIAGNYTLKAKAWKTGATDSAVTAATYAITGQVATASLAAGDNHSLALRSDGIAFGWGKNLNGQVGDGTTTTPKLLPAMVTGLTGAIALDGGGLHSLALRSDGTIVGWGSNGSGRLGDGTTTARPAPVPVSGITTATGIAAGGSHSLARLSNGTVVAWGYNAQGQLGDGTTTEQHSPTSVPGITTAAQVAAGLSFSFARLTTGDVLSWGNNADGQLGDGTQTSRTSPASVSALANVVAIAAGDYHGVALLADGTVKAWGNNFSGQVGDGVSGGRRLTPVAMNIAGVSAIAAGGAHTLLLKTDGTVWATGSNVMGQLGDGTTTDRTTPVQVSSLSNIVAIAAGNQHSLALTSDGVVYTWGRNTNGELGDGTTISSSVPVPISTTGMAWRTATPVVDLAAGLYTSSQTATVTCSDAAATIHYTTTGIDPTAADPTVASGGTISIDQSLTLKVSAWKTGYPTSIVVTRAYELKALAPTLSPGSGAYTSAQTVTLSTATPSADIRYTLDGTEPTSSSTLSSGTVNVASTLTLKARTYRTGWTPSDSTAASYFIDAGTVATPIITPTGGTYTTAPLVSIATTTTGATVRYTLDGTDPTTTSAVYRYPFLVGATTTVKAKAFKPGLTASAIATASYAVDASGATATPTVSPSGGFFATKQTVTVTGPAGATLRYTTTGVDPTTSDTLVPADGHIVVDRAEILKVRAWATGLTASAVRRADFIVTGVVAAGRFHSAAIDANGQLWMWGRNTYGAIGDGTNIDRFSPVAVLSDVVGVAAGDYFTVALKSDGTVWTFGVDGSGQLGVANVGTHYTPTQVPGLTGVVAVAAGAEHTLVLKSDGTVWGFGRNDNGQLGNGSTTGGYTAVQVTGLTGVSRIAAGADFSLAVQGAGGQGGLVWSWGGNASGQLGDGSTLRRTTPVRVGSLDTAVDVAAGQTFGMAKLADGTVRSWGANDDGQLALGPTITNQVSPQVVPSLSAVYAIGSGGLHGLALDASRVVWGWGDGQDGQLALETDGTNWRRWVAERLPGGVDIATIAAGLSHTITGRADGAVLVTGYGPSGPLGLGSTQTRVTSFTQIPSFSLASNAWLLTDSDQDGLAAWTEYLLGLDPLNPDTNGNGVADGVEAHAGSLDGLNPDSDGDGLANWEELARGTDPFRADSDGDGVIDSLDAFPLDPTRWNAPPFDPTDTTPPTITLTYPTNAVPVP